MSNDFRKKVELVESLKERVQSLVLKISKGRRNLNQSYWHFLMEEFQRIEINEIFLANSDRHGPRLTGTKFGSTLGKYKFQTLPKQIFYKKKNIITTTFLNHALLLRK